MNNNYYVHICYYNSLLYFLDKTAPNAISEYTNFKIFLEGHAPRPPRLSCYTA